jgi:hypothetical protein
MTLPWTGEAPTHPGSAGAEALALEARRRHRRGWIFSSVALAVLIGGGSAIYGIASSGGQPRRPRAASVASNAARARASTVDPLHPTSEIVTLSLTLRYNGALENSELETSRITIAPTRPDEDLISSVATSVAPGPSGPNTKTTVRSNVLVLEGVNYVQTLGEWQADKLPTADSDLDDRFAWSPQNSFQFFKDASIGPIATLGHAEIGGVPTTEYRASISRLKVVELEQNRDGYLDQLFQNVNHGSRPLLLELPISIWVDARGQGLQFSAANPEHNSPFAPEGSASSGVTAFTATYTLSNFNASVRIVSRPRKHVVEEPEFSPSFYGKVHVRNSGGSDITERGVLDLTAIPETGQRNNSSLDPSNLLPVGANGAYTGEQHFGGPFRYQISATFYANGTTKLVCKPAAVYIVPTRTSTAVNFTCGP